ncbi:hypothetical protein ACS0TY_009672 [Phlomoides rotata]
MNLRQSQGQKASIPITLVQPPTFKHKSLRPHIEIPAPGDLEHKPCVTKDFRDPKQDHLQVVTKEVQSRHINSSRSRTKESQWNSIANHVQIWITHKKFLHISIYNKGPIINDIEIPQRKEE